jgi:hypothetical protein
MTSDKFAEILARAKAVLAAAQQEKEAAAIQAVEETIASEGVTDVDLKPMGITEESMQTDAGADAAVDAIREVAGTLSRDNDNSNTSTVGSSPVDTDVTKTIGVAREIVLNERQSQFNDIVQSGRDVVLIGAAGTGKTTCQRKVSTDLIDSGKIGPLQAGTKWLLTGVPGAAIVSFTNKAVNNIRHAVDERLRPHVLTIHKLLEFAPVTYEIEDPDKPGEWKKTMRFEPRRNALNPLPPDLKLLGFEESSMVSVELHQLLMDAMPHKHQKFYLGDIQQLPPVFGLAILGFKMLELPVVELTEVYRQAKLSPIIDLAWKILEGNPYEFSSKTEKFAQEVTVQGKKKTLNKIRCPALDKLSISNEHGTVKFQVWQKTIPDDEALLTASMQFNVWGDQGYYNPQDDIILCPYNKAFGTIELNKRISQHLGKKRNACVFEVIAGYQKHYLAVGDRVLYDKEDAFIVDIARNSNYMGPRAMQPSVELDRWGHYQKEPTAEELAAAETDDGILNTEALEKFMAAAATGIDERVQDSSHVVVVKLAYGDGEEIPLDKSAQINNLLGGYALTIHKSQGSEWSKVFIVLHQSHVKMVSRELLYTGCTRARQHLHIICETTSFERGVRSQRIKGDTIEEKAEFFKGKQKDYEDKLGNGNGNGEEKVYGEFQPGIYGGKALPVVLPAAEEHKKAAPLVRLEEFVPDWMKIDAITRCETYWQRATAIWGDKLGSPPVISYNLQRSKVLGVANLRNKTIKLNPVWCIAAATNNEIYELMFRTTLIHEICHHVAWIYSSDPQHGTAWDMAMKLMGIPAEATYSGDTLPPWAETYQAIVADTRQKLVEQNADLSESNESEDGDVG